MGGEIFRTRSDMPWGPPSGYRVFPYVKRPGLGVDHLPPSSAEVKERVQLYLYWFVWAFVDSYRVTFTFTLCLLLKHFLKLVSYIPTGMKEGGVAEGRLCYVYMINRGGQSRESKSCSLVTE